MTNIADDLYLGNFGAAGLTVGATGSLNPTLNQGAGPMGRIIYRNIVPLTKAANNIATAQAMTAATALTLTAGTGITAGTAPDGTGRAVMVLDVARCVSLTTTSNLAGLTFTTVGFDEYGVLLTQTTTGPNNTTVNTLKAFKSVLSVTPSATNGGNITVGTADVFGLMFALQSIAYITSVKWDEVLAPDAGTVVAAVATDPSTALLGDVRGTYAPSSASNGTRRLVIAQHLAAGACGPAATRVGLLGVAQV